MTRRPAKATLALLLVMAVAGAAVVDVADAQRTRAAPTRKAAAPKPPPPAKPPTPPPAPAPKAGGSGTSSGSRTAPVNPCASLNCANGGKCKANGAKAASCQCHPGSFGPTCGDLVAGYYMNAKEQQPKPCPGNAYCNPSLNLCPAGSQTQGNRKTLISDCKLKAGYYCKAFASSATTACTIAVCEAGSFCPGGVPVNTVSGYNGMTPCDCGTMPGCPSSLPGSTSAAACSCAPCGIDQPCDNDNDCSSTYCFSNKCTADPCSGGKCAPNGACSRDGAGYTCSCNQFWTGNDCTVDVDECAADPAICGDNSICTNNVGSYSCACDSGFTPNSSGPGCVDINECDDSTTCVNGLCDNTDGSYVCNCNEGWTGTKCDADIDECEADPTICGVNGSCANTDGSYVCNCNEGWTGTKCDADINECDTSPCADGQLCNNTPGSYECVADPCFNNTCGDGVTCTPNGDGYTCGIGGACADPAQCTSGYCDLADPTNGVCAADPNA